MLFDPVSCGCSHAAFNATLIESIGKCPSVNEVAVVLEKEQIRLQVLRNALESVCVKVLKELPKDKKGNTNHARGYVRFRDCSKVLKKGIESFQPDIVLILAADNLFIPLLLLSLVKQKCGLCAKIVVFHNNMENMRGSWLKRRLWESSLVRNVWVLVLAENVRSAARSVFPRASIHMIPHPTYGHLGIHDDSSVRQEQKYHFVILGRHSRFFNDEGFADEFLTACSQCVSDDEVVLSIAEDELPTYHYSGVKISGYQFPMTDNEYWNMLHSSRFLVIPPQAGKRLSASGVLADALSAGLPVVGPGGGEFEERVPVSCADLLYKDHALGVVVKRALTISDEEYEKMRNDMLSMSEEFSIERTTERLESLFRSIIEYRTLS